MLPDVIFWVSLGLIVYTYVLYPGILIVLRKFSRTARAEPSEELPSVSVIVAAYNEEAVIGERIKNLSEVDYPHDKIDFLIGSDGSTDKTNEILGSMGLSNFRAVIFSARRGKAAVLNELIPQARGQIVVFSDANTSYRKNTIKKLVHHFADPTIGGVCGQLVLLPKEESMGGAGEVSYWTYENYLKQMESDIRTTIGANGAVYAIRRALFKPLPQEKNVADDFLIPIEVVKKGYRIRYEPESRAYERISDSVWDEFRRKVRIGEANFHGIKEYVSLLSPRFGFIAFALWSHKILRWCVPLLLAALMLSNGILYADSGMYQLFLGGQIVFLGLALLGFLCDIARVRIGYFGFPYYFIAMNAALFVGFLKFLIGKQEPTWDVIR